MLVIREAQMEAFRLQRSQQSLGKLADYIRAHKPELVAGWSNNRLEQALKATRERAGLYGISDPLAVIEFFSAMTRYGPWFDAHPAIAAILRDDSIGADNRIHSVWKHTSAETWAETAKILGEKPL